jgi:hypothetical protein
MKTKRLVYIGQFDLPDCSEQTEDPAKAKEREYQREYKRRKRAEQKAKEAAAARMRNMAHSR